eukprot:TRINITY_DN22463_c0_g2_i1.p1 TRINITY_DN22463_c0_g2~~TRINITY_DN22463_c0_g2_i1.p1  ORF type:complete len:118 (-),score=6.12 TRINITY_DN22463_c0_g2_i1:231-584(-)
MRNSNPSETQSWHRCLSRGAIILASRKRTDAFIPSSQEGKEEEQDEAERERGMSAMVPLTAAQRTCRNMSTNSVHNETAWVRQLRVPSHVSGEEFSVVLVASARQSKIIGGFQRIFC